MTLRGVSAATIAARVGSRRTTAEAVVRAALEDIARRDPSLNCFTATFPQSALAEARRVDADIAAGKPPGRLAGVPFAVKDLFDVAGRVTLAGSRVRRDAAPAAADATLVSRLKECGAVLLGSLNMDEFAYGFCTENAHHGTTRNPHAPERIAGGSSGGSAAAVAAGFVPLTLGSDTNGSIRIPAALCGVFGLKPTYGRLSRQGVFPLSDSLDHVGPLAGNAADLTLAYRCLAGAEEAGGTRRRPQASERTARAAGIAARAAGVAARVTGATARAAGATPGVSGRAPRAARAAPRVGVLTGWFRAGATADVLAAVDRVASGFSHVRSIELPQAERARSAAFCITAAEAGNLHFENLRRRAGEFDPATRERLIAGALLPAHVVLQAQRFRRWFQARVKEVFSDVDLLLAPVTPCAATPIGEAMAEIDGIAVAVRANLGIYTQPLSFIGLPVIAAPVNSNGALPLGVQLIGRPWSEAWLLDVAERLENEGLIRAFKETCGENQ